MKINTEKFIDFLKEQEAIARIHQMNELAKGMYIEAYKHRIECETFEWIRLSITGELDTDLGEFMEEDEC